MLKELDKSFIYVIVSRTPTYIGKIIRRALRQKYNHVSISLDKNLTNMYSFGRLMVDNPLIGGIIKESRKSLSLGTNKIVSSKIYKIPVTNEQYEMVNKKISTLFNDSEGYYYNYLGAIGVFLNLKIKLYKTYICSEFVLEVLKEADLLATDKDISLVTPEEITIMLKDYLIFEGELKDYEKDSIVCVEKKTSIKKSRSKASREFLGQENEGFFYHIFMVLKFYSKLIKRNARQR